MSALPERLGRGTTLTAHWLNRLLDWCRSHEILAGPGIKLTRTPTGTTVSAAPGSGCGSTSRRTGVVPVVTKEGSYKDWSDGVPVTLFENGFLLSSTGDDTVYLPEVSGRAAPSPGIACLAHRFESFEVMSGPDEEIEPEEEP